MFPSGSVTPDTDVFVGATIASLLGPTTILALLVVATAFAVIVSGLIADFRNMAALRRMATGGEPPAEPVDSASRGESRQEAA